MSGRFDSVPGSVQIGTMKFHSIGALALLSGILAPAPSLAQEAEESGRYDLALAAGYKALMLCGAIGNSGSDGLRRSAQSVNQYELQGIYPALDGIIRDLPHQLMTGSDGLLDRVTVDWAPDMPPRVAVFSSSGGCTVLPIGATVPAGDVEMTRSQRHPPAHAEVGPDAPHNRSDFTATAQLALGENYGEGTRGTGALIMQSGRILGEAYVPGFDGDLPQRTWSVAKSIAATLIGAAVYRGEMDVLAPAAIEAWSAEGDPRRAITVDNLLRMASGRYSDTPGNRTDPIYWGGATVDERAATWPLLHPPGSVFRYANNDTLMAVEAIAPTFAAHPPAELFGRLGMRNTVAETDWQGNYILSSQVWSTTRDLARLGQLYLQNGVWNGTRVLPEDWASYVAAPAGPQPENYPFGYGAGFWLLNKSEGVPMDTFAAMGNRGQYIVIVPSRDVVIVRRGEDPAGSRFDIAAFTRDVLERLPKDAD